MAGVNIRECNCLAFHVFEQYLEHRGRLRLHSRGQSALAFASTRGSRLVERGPNGLERRIEILARS